MSQAPPLIMSVDDSEDITSLLRMMLEAEGYRVKTFNEGQLALAELESGRLAPDLILLDLDMPTMNGYEVCEKLQERPDWALIPVVFLTASGGQANRLKAFQLGAVGFLDKPVDPDALPSQIQRFLEVRQKWKQSFTPTADGPEVASEVKPASTRVPAVRSGFSGFKHFLGEQTSCVLPEQLKPEQLYDQAADQGLLPEQLARLIAAWSQTEFLEAFEPDGLKLGVLPTPFCRKYQVVPIGFEGKPAFILSNPFYMELDDILQRYGRGKRYIAPPRLVESLLSGRGLAAVTQGESQNLEQIAGELQARYQPVEPEQLEIKDGGDENAAPLIRLVNRLIENAWRQHASDIHIEPGEKEVVVRYRVDGELRVVSRLQPASLIQPIAARLKVMSNLNIAEKRLPQDGRIVFSEHGNRQVDVDLRVATAPMNYGEKIVMRLIDKQKSSLPLEALGFSERNLQQYRIQLQNPYGMILHVGPTGSGKSMTLYAALNELSRPEINIQTAEDPIEYTLPGINQLQVKPEIGLTFARALRAYLRQDPDVILVGEIRDHETAEVALEAALTGHLLLSTLHTNDAAATLLRFVEMGMEPYLVSASVVMICAQRLLRRLCVHCRQPGAATPEQKALLGWPLEHELILYWSQGCQHCDGSGYRGRIGVHELLIPGDAMRQALGREGISAEDLKKLAVKEGMTTLFWDGVDKAVQGLTSLEEVCAKVRLDEFDSRPAWWRERVG